MSALKDLEKRLEEAAAGDRELDSKIANIFSHDVESDDGDWWWGPYNEPPVRVPDFSTSLDAAVSLAKRLFPDRLKELLMAAVDDWSRRTAFTVEEFPRFMCLATVRALIAKGGASD